MIKKFILLMSVFILSLFSFPLLNVHAVAPSIDSPIAELNNQSVKQFFENNNLISYNNTTPYLKTYGTNASYFVTKSLGNLNFFANNVYWESTYFNVKFPTNTSITGWSVFSQYVLGGANRSLGSFSSSSNQEYIFGIRLNSIYTNIWGNVSNVAIQKYAQVTPTSYFFDIDDYIEIKQTVIINLTALNLASLSYEKLNNYYNQYLLYNDNTTIYNQGVTDGSPSLISSAYLNGYNQGVNDGMDTATATAINSGIFIFLGLIITIGLMLAGFMTRIRIFNLLAVGSTIFFMTFIGDSPALMIVAVGIVLLNIVYTFFGLTEG